MTLVMADKPEMQPQIVQGIDWRGIVQIVEARRNARSPIINMMLQVRDRYQADYVIPDPTSRTDDPSPILTPALIAQAIDQPALRAASVLPGIYVPPLSPGVPLSINRALARQGAYWAAWRKSRMPLMLRRAYRHLRAYDTCAITVEPAIDGSGVPDIQLRDPLSAYPEPQAPEDLSLPMNCAFVYGKSATWLRSYFPACRIERGGPVPAPENVNVDDVWDVVEWMDNDVIVFGLIGPRNLTVQARAIEAGAITQDLELSRYENKAGKCTAIVPSTVSLDQIASQVAKVIGHVDLQGQILGLEIAAVQKAIWPDRYIIGKGSSPPQLVSGPGWKEGQSGQVNIITDATQVGELRGTPDPSAERIQDKLERHARISTGLIPQMGGETSGAARTGRGLDTLGAWAVDPQVQELQEVMAFSLESVNEAINATFLGYEPSKKFFLFHGVGEDGFTEFTPKKELREDCHSRVSYAVTGTDRQGTTVTLGQLVGAKLISHETARMKHPDIEDGIAEGRRILGEDLDEALKVSILQRASTPDAPGAIVPEDMAKIRAKVRTGMPLDQAVMETNNERSQVQATPPDQLEPGQAQPGLAGPQEGTGPPGAPPMGLDTTQMMHSPQAPDMGVEGPTQDQQRLKQLAAALRANPGGAQGAT